MGRRRWTAGLAWTLAGLALLLLVPGLRLSLLVEADNPFQAPAIAAAYSAVALALVSSAAVGAVLASRRPGHPVGWLLLGIGLGIALSGLVESYAEYGLVVRPGSLPGARYLAGFAVLSVTVVWLSCAGFVLLLTPTGSLPSPRWRWWARVAGTAPAVFVLGAAVQPDPLAPDWYGNPLAVPALYRLLVVPGVVAIAVVLASVLVGAVSLLLRFRHARGVERQQLRWLALAAGLAGSLLLAALVAGFLSLDPVVLALISLCVSLLPLGTGAAILRYRLYDLDRVISRTVAYGLLTVLLGLGYAAVVLGLGRLLGQESSLVVAAATLAVAAAFQPARRRIQRVVDRRFNRRRYDAAGTVEAFAARLRDQIDLGALHGELLAVVEQTVQPASASLWLRPPGPTAGGEAAG
jgi:MFS family permease